MTMQMAAAAKLLLYHSIHQPALPDFPTLLDPIVNVPPLKSDDELGDTQEKVTVILEDGTEINDIDVVLLGTGYRPNPGFIYVLPLPSPTPIVDWLRESHNTSLGPVPLMSLLLSNSSYQNHVPHLHHHILYAYSPMLAFISPEITFNPFTITDLASFETRRIAGLKERSRSPDEITYDMNAGPWKGRGNLRKVLAKWNEEKRHKRVDLFVVELRALR
ncbi:hypothetical protein GYMLUDRAFT_60418 [Collybiopsis luxurians FD-317 M1]|uniref:FAD/NAD(P)-binding domain-containing protein n=1 Tax=Collybiopsis luxurians FD-317 M1 TaxID=944289 RepID=A0A0D0CT28_9AGAR|nr:hypothetical protein GYMLUDRAFT_60418 [Collybiopsis luxurians FD-317 M1]